MHRNDRVPVADRRDISGVLPNRFTDLSRKFPQIAHRRVFLEDHLAVLLRINLQRVAAADNTDTENLVLSVRRTLDNFSFVGVDAHIDPRADRVVRPYKLGFDIFRAGLKICGVLRERASLEQVVNVRLELYLDVILVDPDFFDHQIQVIAVK